VSEPLAFLFGVHNHQPIGNFEFVLEEAVARAYGPFLGTLARAPHVRAAVHCSGGLLRFLRERARPTFDLLGRLASDRQVELLTGGFYEPILPMLPEVDRLGQIQAMTEFLRAEFGVRPRGMWVAERVWEPQLPTTLRGAGVEYVLLDDAHFALAGLDPEELGGYYVTEDQGAPVAVFPISQRLRYLIPFADPAETLAYLEARRDAGAVTLVDDGEKFGLWPGTHRWVYDEGWLARFFEALGTAAWLRCSTFAHYLDTHPPRGRIYLPTAAYTEMGEWALPAVAARDLEEARKRLKELPDGERLVRLLRGGFWRNFLVKYPEVADCYWKMLRLSGRLHAALRARPGDPGLERARERLWQGQGNDAYWHGIFGGCYLPHLRRSVRGALLGCERLLREAGAGPAVEWEEGDLNGDGRVEVSVRTPELSITLNPARGGTFTELGWPAAELDAADVLARRAEAYHAQVKDDPAAEAPGQARTIHAEATAKEVGLRGLLVYDPWRRACLLDALFPEGPEVDALQPWEAARMAVGERPMAHEIAVSADAVTVECRLEHPDGVPLGITKSVLVAAGAPRLEARYRLRWDGPTPLRARWGVQLNLALTAGEAPGRYFRLPGRPSLGSRGRLDGRRELVLVDEWLGVALTLEWDPPAEVAWAPVETVSLSEAGFERVYQGTALLVLWPLRLDPRGERQLVLRLGFARLPEGDFP
jgi:alpha-amylase